MNESVNNFKKTQSWGRQNDKSVDNPLNSHCPCNRRDVVNALGLNDSPAAQACPDNILALAARHTHQKTLCLL